MQGGICFIYLGEFLLSVLRKKRKERTIEDWILRIQSVLTYFLLACFAGIVLFVMFYPEEAADRVVVSFLPIVTGWLGIIFGFYFSREISKFLENRLADFREDQTKKVEQYEQRIAEIEKEKENEVNRIKELLEKREAYLSKFRDRTSKLLLEKGRKRRRK